MAKIRGMRMNRQYQKNNGNTAVSGFVGNRMALRRKQKGITAIGMAIILGLVAFFALIALRLLPIYLEYFNVSSHLDRLASESETQSRTNEEIYDTLMKRYQLDDVENVTTDEIYIDRQGGELKISVEYEVRTTAIGNVDMIVSFSKEVDVK